MINYLLKKNKTVFEERWIYYVQSRRLQPIRLSSQGGSKMTLHLFKTKKICMQNCLELVLQFVARNLGISHNI